MLIRNKTFKILCLFASVIFLLIVPNMEYETGFELKVRLFEFLNYFLLCGLILFFVFKHNSIINSKSYFLVIVISLLVFSFFKIQQELDITDSIDKIARIYKFKLFKADNINSTLLSNLLLFLWMQIISVPALFWLRMLYILVLIILSSLIFALYKSVLNRKILFISIISTGLVVIYFSVLNPTSYIIANLFIFFSILFYYKGLKKPDLILNILTGVGIALAIFSNFSYIVFIIFLFITELSFINLKNKIIHKSAKSRIILYTSFLTTILITFIILIITNNLNLYLSNIAKSPILNIENFSFIILKEGIITSIVITAFILFVGIVAKRSNKYISQIILVIFVIISLYFYSNYGISFFYAVLFALIILNLISNTSILNPIGVIISSTSLLLFIACNFNLKTLLTSGGILLFVPFVFTNFNSSDFNEFKITGDNKVVYRAIIVILIATSFLDIVSNNISNKKQIELYKISSLKGIYYNNSIQSDFNKKIAFTESLWSDFIDKINEENVAYLIDDASLCYLLDHYPIGNQNYLKSIDNTIKLTEPIPDQIITLQNFDGEEDKLIVAGNENIPLKDFLFSKNFDISLYSQFIRVFDKLHYEDIEIDTVNLLKSGSMNEFKSSVAKGWIKIGKNTGFYVDGCNFVDPYFSQRIEFYRPGNMTFKCGYLLEKSNYYHISAYVLLTSNNPRTISIQSGISKYFKTVMPGTWTKVSTIIKADKNSFTIRGIGFKKGEIINVDKVVLNNVNRDID